MPDVAAVIPAGGRGSRMKAEINKQYIPLGGIPLLARTLMVFEGCSLIREIIVVAAPGEEDLCRERVIEPFGFTKKIKIATGGRERQDSVFNGLMEVDPSCEYVAVHDGARPLLTHGILMYVLDAAFEEGAAVAAVPVKDTVKVSDEKGYAVVTPDRSRLWAVQTPQVYKRELILEAYENARRQNFKGSDDAVLVERLGHPVKLVMGSYENLKITTPEDLEVAEAILRRRGELR
ncbi:MAG: 2-C-methyl-D-erythritol 4-phosphate cytidylyltransferase [Clostridia bacterium]|nr:2-C-methyl-D-erythritol 4-phosphate cytidylyltransferase [Clostridia bacterium]